MCYFVSDSARIRKQWRLTIVGDDIQKKVDEHVDTRKGDES